MALERAMRSSEINQKLFPDNQCNSEIAINLVNISNIYQGLQNFPEALAYAKRAQEIFENLHALAPTALNKRQLAICIANIGFLY